MIRWHLRAKNSTRLSLRKIFIILIMLMLSSLIVTLLNINNPVTFATISMAGAYPLDGIG
jgi:hypothetical protein